MSTDQFTSPALAPLAAAVASGDGAEIRRQLAHVDPDTPGSNGDTLLLEAIRHGRGESVRALLEGGADPNRAGANGDTPVHAAAFAEDPDLLRAVLDHGGEPNVRNPLTGATPLVPALLGRHPQQLRALLDGGADPNLGDRNDDAPLHVAARTNNGAAILLLLERGAAPLARNSGGAGFQDYYFAFRREVLSERALAERREIVAWLKAHHVPLSAKVEPTY